MSIATVTLNPCIDRTLSVERVVADRKLTGRDSREYPGGGGINVARVVARLGADVSPLWSCGGDTGRRLACLLEVDGVVNHPVPIEGSIRENLIVRDCSTGEQYRFNLPGPTLTKPERERWQREIRNLPASTRFVVFSGSLPFGVPAEWYEELVRSVPEGPRVVVDTKQQALSHALRVGVFLIKPNVRELGDLTNRELTDDVAIEQACRDLVARGGTEVVVVSLGRAGALQVTRDKTVRFSTPSVRLRSKVGAGDSMVGGMVTALSRGSSVTDAVKFGVAAGAAAVMTEGTELCYKDDAEHLYASVGHAGER